jgi:hypothetical protein
MRARSFDGSPPGWAAQLVLRELHTADGPLTAVNLAGRCFLPARHVGDALRELEQAGLASRRGRRWHALERRSHDAEPGTERRRERRGIDAERRFPAA